MNIEKTWRIFFLLFEKMSTKLYFPNLFIFPQESDTVTKAEEQRAVTIFAACHITAMTTVCINPLLYGWCNTNFKQVQSLLLLISIILFRILIIIVINECLKV